MSDSAIQLTAETVVFRAAALSAKDCLAAKKLLLQPLEPASDAHN